MKKVVLMIVLIWSMLCFCCCDKSVSVNQDAEVENIEKISEKSEIISLENKKETHLRSEACSAKKNEKYIGNKRSKKLHREHCNTLPKAENRAYFFDCEDAMNEGYVACQKCNLQK